MQKRIGFIGSLEVSTPGSKDNTGNNVHGHAARNLFSNWKNIRTSLADENISQIRESFTHLGYAAATMLHTKKTPKYVDVQVHVTEFIEKLNLPVVVFGFGCHARLGDNVADANVDERSVRLLQVMAERADTVAVRGEFTADLCAKYGVKNVTIIGCQSAYIAAVLNLENRALQSKAERPVINTSMGPDERPLLRLGMAANAGIIGQGDYTEEKISRDQISKADFVADTENYTLYPSVSRAIKNGEFSRGAYFDYIKTNFHKFYDVPGWRAYMAENYDFCAGTRFHGNMTALQAGLPALWIEHDLRTQELCRHLNLPSIRHETLNDYSSMQDLAAACSYDAFWKQMPARTREFYAYIKNNGAEDLLNPQIKDGFQKLMAE